MINPNVITLGIGPQSDIGHFILLGLTSFIVPHAVLVDIEIEPSIKADIDLSPTIDADIKVN